MVCVLPTGNECFFVNVTRVIDTRTFWTRVIALEVALPPSPTYRDQ